MTDPVPTTVNQNYKRLPGRRWTGFFRCSLWLGQDHLLKLTSTNYTEEYRRFYFKDIQSITYARTNTGPVLNAVGLVALMLLGLIYGYGEVPGKVFSGILGIPLFFVVLFNIFLGATCVCRIQTAVQSDKLESLGRLRNAIRVTERLRPIILQSQGGFTEEDRAAMAQAAPRPASTATRPMEPPPLWDQVPPPSINAQAEPADNAATPGTVEQVEGREN